MDPESPIRLEIYESIPLPNEINKILETGPNVNQAIKELSGTITDYDANVGMITVKLNNGVHIKIKQIMECPSPGETLKVKKVQTGGYEKIS